MARISVLILALYAANICAAEKPRLLVLTDMGADPDDQQSMVRLLLYANAFDIEGLIATSAGTTGKREQHATHPELIRELVVAYGQARGNLVKHADGYPTAENLLTKIKIGSSQRGQEAIGAGLDTEASAWIIRTIDHIDARPLCISVWGGQTDLAQALWRIKQDRGVDGLNQVRARLRIYDIADQDGLAKWIQELCPGQFYIQAGAPMGRDKREGAFRGMYLGGDESLVGREWMETNIRQEHGPLGALYPPKTWTAPNPHSAIKEGDTPSWLYFLPHGLHHIEHPEWGGFGGRFERDSGGIYRDAQDRAGAVHDARATVWRWREAVQADFQGRLDWCVADAFGKANHAPRAVLNGDRSRNVVELPARVGEVVTLSAAESNDPDGNKLHYRWFIYREPSVLADDVTLTSTDGVMTSFTVPQNDRASIHVVLQATDNGSPPLSVFRRVVISGRK